MKELKLKEEGELSDIMSRIVKAWKEGKTTPHFLALGPNEWAEYIHLVHRVARPGQSQMHMLPDGRSAEVIRCDSPGIYFVCKVG